MSESKVPEKLKLVQSQLNRYAQQHALAVIIGPPPSVGGDVNTASACVIDLSNTVYVLTAAHVYTEYKSRVERNALVRWQIMFPAADDGGLARSVAFDPRERLRSIDIANDIVALELTSDEAAIAGACVCSMPLGWPPPRPEPGALATASGYPALYRDRLGHKRFEFKALSFLLEVTTSGEFHVTMQWNRDEIVRLSGPPVPEPGVNLGGLSGGPVFLVSDLSYPIVGIVTDFHSSYEIVRISHLGAAALGTLAT
jgi:hypothetical protein